MSISFELPGDVVEALQRRVGDLNQAAREAMAVEMYRQGQLTHHQFSRILSLSRIEADEVLKQHGVSEDRLTPEEHAAELKGLRELLN